MGPDLEKSLPPEDTGRFRRLKKLVPSDGTEGLALQKWRLYIGLSSYCHWMFVVAVSALLSVGVPPIGQLAWANDVERKMDTKIAAAVRPIEEKVAELAEQSKAQNAISNAFLARLAEDSIIETLKRMCDEQLYSPEWRRLNSDYSRFRADYARATGREYRELGCSDTKKK